MKVCFDIFCSVNQKMSKLFEIFIRFLFNAVYWIAVIAVDWNQFNMGSNPVPIETFAKYGRIDHLRVINPLKSQ